MLTPRFGVLAVLLSLGLLGTACSDDNNERASTEPEEEGAPAENTCETVDLTQPPEEPVTIRVGHGAAAEEQVWLMGANPDITEHQGTWYELEMNQFRANEERFVAYQAGELDALTSAAPSLISAVAAGMEVRASVSVSQEAAEGEFRTTFVALDDSGIAGPEDLEGKKIGIVDIGSATEYWAKSAVASAGLDPESDVEYVVLPFPAQEEALRNGQIDVAVMVEPFYTLAQNGGGLVDVFDSLTGPAIDQELILFGFDDQFREENPEVVCAWIEDFTAATAWYAENEDEAKQLLVDEEFVVTPIEVYTSAGDWLRPEDPTIDVATLDELITSMVEFGVLTAEQEVPASQVVASDFAPAG